MRKSTVSKTSIRIRITIVIMANTAINETAIVLKKTMTVSRIWISSKRFSILCLPVMKRIKAIIILDMIKKEFQFFILKIDLKKSA